MPSMKPQSREPLNTRQRNILVEFYNKNPYPSTAERLQLSQTTGRTLKQVQDWFSNRRRNDLQLITGKTVSLTNTIRSSPSATPVEICPINSSYEFSSPVSVMTNMCPCCYQTQWLVNSSCYYPPDSSYLYSHHNYIQPSMYQ